MALTITERRPVAILAASPVLSSAPLAKTIPLREPKVNCASCHWRESCLTKGLDAHGLREFDAAVAVRTRHRKGETLFRNGVPFTALYAIRFGSCKTTVLSEDGREQITGYHMPGDIIGMDGVGTDRHRCEAIGLEEIEVCALPFDRLERLARTSPQLQHNLHQLLSRDICRDQDMMLLLGSMRAEERLAGFLLNLSGRYQRRGFSSTEFVLRLTRDEIGSHLGLKLETISRLFSRFQEAGLLQVQGRGVKLLDLSMLRVLAGGRA